MKKLTLLCFILIIFLSFSFKTNAQTNDNIAVEGVEEGEVYTKPNIKFYLKEVLTKSTYLITLTSGKTVEYIDYTNKKLSLYLDKDGNIVYTKDEAYFMLTDLDGFSKTLDSISITKDNNDISFKIDDGIFIIENADDIFKYQINTKSEEVDNNIKFIKDNNLLYIDNYLIGENENVTSIKCESKVKNKIVEAKLNDTKITTNTTIKGEKFKNGKYTLSLTDAFGNVKEINFTLDNSPYIFEVTKILLKGTINTIKLFVITLLLSIPLGLFGAMLKRIKFKPLRLILDAYTWVIRGTPLLLQLFVVYFGIPILFGEKYALEPFAAASITFVINYSAYFVEIFRGGIESINKGQFEASYVLGLNKVQTYVYIIIPQTLKRVLPSITNEVITLVKDTALASAITFNDLLFYTKQKVTLDFRLEPYFVAFVLYLLFSFVIVWICNKIEKKYSFYN